MSKKAIDISRDNILQAMKSASTYNIFQTSQKNKNTNNVICKLLLIYYVQKIIYTQKSFYVDFNLYSIKNR